MIAGEGGFFAAGLEFDELTSFIHDKVHIDRSGDVFHVAEVQQWLAADHADANRGDREIWMGG